VKKLLLIGTVVLLTATSASAQSYDRQCYRTAIQRLYNSGDSAQRRLTAKIQRGGGYSYAGHVAYANYLLRTGDPDFRSVNRRVLPMCGFRRAR
jgi:hypothetical protein